MSKHAPFAPSSAARWAHCTKSFYRHEQTGGSSWYANEGSFAHEVAAKILEDPNYDVRQHLGHRGDGGKWTFTDDSLMFVRQYTDYIMDLMAQYEDSVLYVEKKVYAQDENEGTSDAIVLWPSVKMMHVCDLKFGRGVAVEAENNDQARNYGYGAMRTLLDPLEHAFHEWTIRNHIIQPRSVNGRTESEETLTWGELDVWYQTTIDGAISVIRSGEQHTTYNPGEKQCQWCSHAPDCRALAAYNLEAASFEFADFVTEEFQTIGQRLGLTRQQEDTPITPYERGQILDKLDLLELWIKTQRNRAAEEALAGNVPNGYKVVESVKHRKWIPDLNKASLRKIVEAAGKNWKDAFKVELRTPNQVQQLVGKDRKGDVELFVYKPKGDPVLAKDTDKRPLYQRTAEEDFKDVPV